MACGGYVFISIYATVCVFIHSLAWVNGSDNNGILGVFQVFGPSDAVDFVQKLLSVRISL